MILPSTYFAALFVTILAMFCWGSWANSFKLTRKWRFELFYFDLALGFVLAAVIAALTVGTLGFDGFSFVDDVRHAGFREDAWAMISGGVFTLANMLLVAAVSIAGMSVAFPIVFGVALVVGVIWNYSMNPVGNRELLFGGAASVIAAIIVTALAYRAFALQRSRQAAREGRARQVRKSMSTKGIVISIVSGVLMAIYHPLLQNAMIPDIGLGPYSVTFVFAVGAFISTFVFNLVLMNLPLEGSPMEITDYFRGGLRNHLLGVLGGAIWTAGMLCVLVTLSVEGPAKVDPELTYGLVQGAAVVSALWGLLVWREFSGAGANVKSLLSLMLVLFTGGVALVSIAPLH